MKRWMRWDGGFQKGEIREFFHAYTYKGGGEKWSAPMGEIGAKNRGEKPGRNGR